MGHSVKTLGECRARAYGLGADDDGVGGGGGAAEPSLAGVAGVGGLGEWAGPLADAFSKSSANKTSASSTAGLGKRTGGLSDVLSPNSFSTTVLVFAYIALTRLRNGSTNGCACS